MTAKEDNASNMISAQGMGRSKGSISAKSLMKAHWKSLLVILLVGTIVFGYAVYLTYFYQGVADADAIGRSITAELDFQVETLDGQVKNISQFAGSPLIIDFFATWCAPCKDQVHAIKAFLQDHQDVNVVSVSVDPLDNLDKLTKYRDENGITWTIGRDAGLRGSTKFDVSALPTVVFVDQNGIVRKLETRIVPESQLEAWYQDSQASVIKLFGFQVWISSEWILFPLFFLIGLYVALSPCLFPIMPLTIFNIMGKQSASNQSPFSAPTREFRKGALKWTLLLCSGILLSFALFALVGLFIGMALLQFRYELGFFLGLILLLLGLFMILPRLEERTFARIPVPRRVSEFLDKEEFSAIDLFLLGFLYSIIALPCAGPAILSVIPIVASLANPLLTLGALVIFGVGLFIPYLALVLVTTEGQARAISFLQRRTTTIQLLAGILLIVMGLLFVSPLLGGPDFIYRFGT